MGGVACLRGMILQEGRIGNTSDTERAAVFYLFKVALHPRIHVLGLDLAAIVAAQMEAVASLSACSLRSWRQKAMIGCFTH